MEQYVIEQILLIFVSCAKSCKNYDFYYVFIRNFVQIKIFFSKECAISCKPGFVLKRKKVISCKNSKLLRKRIYCFVETLCVTEHTTQLRQISL